MGLRTSRIVAVVALALLGCGANPTGEEQPSSDPAVLSSRLQSLDHDLGLGSNGDDVRALNAYLTQFGYFPNKELAQQYPKWRPVVPHAPPDPAEFGATTTEAVRALQSHAGLSATGIVDAPTRELLRTPRCDFPESAPSDPAEKFAIHASHWERNMTIYWQVPPFPGGGPPNGVALSVDQVRSATSAALAVWSAQTNVTFVEVAGDASPPPNTILIKFANKNDILKYGNCTYGYMGGLSTCTLNTQKTWSVATPTPTTSSDLQSVLIHEVGHSLGLEHSSYSSAQMYVSGLYLGMQRRSLTPDDRVAISLIYDDWRYLGGSAGQLASDIAVGPRGDLWIAGTNPAPGGFEIRKWNGTSWDLATGNRGGNRVAVDPLFNVWMVDLAGNIYVHARNPGSGGWTNAAGCATDIGVSDVVAECNVPNCTPTLYYYVWKIGCVPDADGNRSIARLKMPLSGRISSIKVSNWVESSLHADRIAVSTGGQPWIARYDGTVWRLPGTDTGATWLWTADAYAWDIGVGPNNYAWIAGQDSIFAYNSQTGIPADEACPPKNEWRSFDQYGARHISVGPGGEFYVVEPNGEIWTTQK